MVARRNERNPTSVVNISVKAYFCNFLQVKKYIGAELLRKESLISHHTNTQISNLICKATVIPYEPRLDNIDLSSFSESTPIVYTKPEHPWVEDPNIVDNGMDCFGVPEGFKGTTITDENGIKRSYNLDGNLCGTSTVARKPSEYREDMEAFGNRYFYKAPMDFLLDAAKHYAKIEDKQEFKYRPTQDSDFVMAVTSFFNGDKTDKEQSALWIQLHAEIDIAVRELATQLKNGNTPDITQLKSTLTIDGVGVTFNELKDMQQQSQKFFDALGAASSGRNSVQDWGSRGLVKGAVMAYGDSLGGDLGKLFNKAFGRAADENLNACNDLFKTIREVWGGSSNAQNLENANAIDSDFGNQAYELFSKVRNQHDFDSAMNDFDRLLDKYNEAWKGSADSHHLDAMRKVLMDANIMIDWK